MYHVVIYTHIYEREPSLFASRTYAHICRYMYTRIYVDVYSGVERSERHRRGEASSLSFSRSDSRDHGPPSRTRVRPSLTRSRAEMGHTWNHSWSCSGTLVRKSSCGIILILISRMHENGSYARTRRATQKVHKNSGLRRIPYLFSSLNDGIDRRATCSLRKKHELKIIARVRNDRVGAVESTVVSAVPFVPRGGSLAKRKTTRFAMKRGEAIAIVIAEGKG